MSAAVRRPPGSALYWFLAVYAAYHVVWLAMLAADLVTHPLAGDRQFASVAFRLLTGGLVVPAALVIAGLVIRRAPGNVVGLCLLLWATTIMGTALRPDSPLAVYESSVDTGWTGLWLLGLYFPDGQLAFRRLARPIRLLSAAMVVLVATWTFFQPTRLLPGHLGPLPNPAHLPLLAPLRPLADTLETVSGVGVVLLILPSLVVRYLRGDLRTRHQIRWLAWAYGVLFLMIIPLATTGLIANGQDVAARQRYGLAGDLGLALFGIYAPMAPYVAVGNAILRHRLYDIDVIIRRTLVYALLTGSLALVYLGTVLLLQSLLSATTGQQSPLAIVLSTLVIVGLFAPLRRRVQAVVDRRFYRRKYDAARALTAFAAAVRDETDLATLTGRLAGVVGDTMEPAHLSVWLAGESR